MNSIIFLAQPSLTPLSSSALVNMAEAIVTAAPSADATSLASIEVTPPPPIYATATRSAGTCVTPTTATASQFITMGRCFSKPQIPKIDKTIIKLWRKHKAWEIQSALLQYDVPTLQNLAAYVIGMGTKYKIHPQKN